MKEFQFGEKTWRLVRPFPVGRDMKDSNGLALSGKKRHYIKVRKRHDLKAVEFSDLEKEELYTLLHEAAHAQNWDLDESAVIRKAREITEFLWSLGYRMSGPPN